jgi:hypothetical protein
VRIHFRPISSRGNTTNPNGFFVEDFLLIFEVGSSFFEISFSVFGKARGAKPPSRFAICPVRPIVPPTSSAQKLRASRAYRLAAHVLRALFA